MDKLTDHAQHPDTFLRCQLCGKLHPHICELDMWQECDEDDELEDKWIILCREGDCHKRLQDHDRLYHKVPWSMGGPGRFMLVCGNCDHRDEFDCKHPNLKANGGDGLEVMISRPLGTGWICGGDGCKRIENLHGPANACEGNPGASERRYEQGRSIREDSA